MFENGEAGVGFWSACVNSCAAMVEFTVDDRYGIFPLWGKNLTVFATRSCEV